MEIKYYDENYYLNQNNRYERAFLLNQQSLWNTSCICEKILYSSLIKDYNSYVNLVNKLIDEITPEKNSLSKINTITYLIMNGIFSYSTRFDFVPIVDDVLHCKTGLNIIDGIGCCRHISEFITDVIPESSILTCAVEVENQFESEANHVINAIKYNGKIYGFDASNGGVLLDFVNEFKMIPIDRYEKECFYYKPYAEIVFYKRGFEEIKMFLERIKENNKIKISLQEVERIALDSFMSINNNKDIIKDFLRDTKEEMEIIQEKIKEIKIRR